MLVLVAFMSLILGMGLPTTANYIVVSSLMAPVIVMVGAQNGLIVPLSCGSSFCLLLWNISRRHTSGWV